MNSSNNVIGELYLKVENFCFPEEGWNDFVVVVLGWWQKTIMNIRNSKIGTTHEFDFMDGPLFVKSTKISEDTMELEFTKEKSDSRQIFFTCVCKISQFQEAILNVTKKLLMELKSRKWHSDDIEELERMWKLLNSPNP